MIALLFLVVVLGLVIYVVETVLPLGQPFRNVIRAIAAIILIWYLLHLVGLAPPVPR